MDKEKFKNLEIILLDYIIETYDEELKFNDLDGILQNIDLQAIGNKETLKNLTSLVMDINSNTSYINSNTSYIELPKVFLLSIMIQTLENSLEIQIDINKYINHFSDTASQIEGIHHSEDKVKAELEKGLKYIKENK